MAAETVRIYAVDENSDPLEGVLVRFFDDTDTFVTQQYTALVAGEAYAEVTVDGDDPPNTYTVRLSKTGVAFDGTLGDDSKTPQSVDIYSPAASAPVTGTNNFQVQGQTFSAPAPSDPRLCRASGYFVDHSGRPLKNLDVHFIAVCYNENQPDWFPMIVDGKGVLSTKIYARTDERGYLQVDLYRTGEYAALVEGLEHSRRTIKVPDVPQVNIVDLLFPVVSEVTFATNPITVASGSYVDVDLTILATDGQELDGLDRDVTFASSDYGVASAQVLAGNILRVSGIGAGTTQITAIRADTSIVTIPEEPVTYTPLDVTVV